MQFPRKKEQKYNSYGDPRLFSVWKSPNDRSLLSSTIGSKEKTIDLEFWCASFTHLLILDIHTGYGKLTIHPHRFGGLALWMKPVFFSPRWSIDLWILNRISDGTQYLLRVWFKNLKFFQNILGEVRRLDKNCDLLIYFPCLCPVSNLSLDIIILTCKTWIRELWRSM